MPPYEPVEDGPRRNRAHPVEVLLEGAQLGAHEAKRRVVDDVQHVRAVRPQHALDLTDELGGGQVPRHREAAEGVAHDEVGRIVGSVADPESGIADLHPKVGPGGQPEPLLARLQHGLVDLEHRAPRARVRGPQVPGHGETAPADVQRVEGGTVGERDVDDVGERPDVLELEARRVVEIDVAVTQVVEPERASARVQRIALDEDAVVRALEVARLVHIRTEGGRRAGKDRDRDHDRAVAARQPEAQRDADRDQHAADRVDHRAGGRGGDEQEPGDERADDRAEGGDPTQPAHGPARVLEALQLQLHDHRVDRAQHEGGGEEARDGEPDDGEASAVARGGVAERAHDRDGEEGEQPAQRDGRAEEAAGVDLVGEPPADPCAGGDAGEHGADDRRVGLEADPHVGREQASGQDLEHEHAARADEHEDGGQERGHRRSLAEPRSVNRSAERRVPAATLLRWAASRCARSSRVVVSRDRLELVVELAEEQPVELG